jgi:hypothetical protein
MKSISLVAATALALMTNAAWANHEIPVSKLPPPIDLGVSGGTIQELELVSGSGLFSCTGGTLGAAVENTAGDLFILSNNHVLGEHYGVVPNALGDEVIQPSLFDIAVAHGSCGGEPQPDTHSVVANLSESVPIQTCTLVRGIRVAGCPDNFVDAAIALVADCGTESCVQTDDPVGNAANGNGTNLNIGVVGHDTVDAASALGMTVQKDGGTTGHTTGTVAAIDAEIRVFYGTNPNAVDQVLVPELQAQFSGQLRISGAGFAAGGDSGSVAFECVDAGGGVCAAEPAAVGLVFALSNEGVFANPIDTVLTSFTDPLAMAGCLDSETVPTPGDETCFPVADGGGGGKGGGGNGGGGNGGGGGGGPPGGRGPSGSNILGQSLGLQHALDTRAAHSAALFDITGVVGSGVGLDADGEPVIEVYISSSQLPADSPIPDVIDGVPTRIVATGIIQAR